MNRECLGETRQVLEEGTLRSPLAVIAVTAWNEQINWMSLWNLL
jgi:hypothetical protein